VSVIDGLLARIKALFEPGRPAPPDQAVEQPPPHRIEPANEAPPAAIAPPPVEEAGAGAPDGVGPPALVAQAPTPVTEAPAPVAEAPTVAAEAPTFVAEAPTLVEEAPADVEEARGDVEGPTVAAAPAGGVTLRLESERGPRSTFEVTKSGATIGRGPESTIQLADLSVSRKHAKITYKQGAYWLSDLGSMGGTWINGTKLAAPRRVATGQTIDIGLCRLTVVAAAEGEKSGAAAKGPSNAA
jgi:hypothetical protein